MDKLYAYVHHSPGEISGFGLGRPDLEIPNSVRIEDVFILEQEVMAGHTELSEEAMADLLFTLVKRNKDPEDVCLWWHSHPGPQKETGFSPTDHATIDRIGLLGRDWMVSLVLTNIVGYAQLDFYRPARAWVEMEIVRECSPKITEKVKKEIDKLVTKVPPKQDKPASNFRGSEDSRNGGRNGGTRGVNIYGYPVVYNGEHREANPWQRDIDKDDKGKNVIIVPPSSRSVPAPSAAEKKTLEEEADDLYNRMVAELGDSGAEITDELLEQARKVADETAADFIVDGEGGIIPADFSLPPTNEAGESLEDDTISAEVEEDEEDERRARRGRKKNKKRSKSRR